MDRQCSSCGGFCKKSGCERENVKPEPEPVAWMYKGEPWFDGTIWHDQSEVTTHKRVAMFKDKNAKPLYTAPPQREWVGLTDEEIREGNKDSWVTRQAWESAAWWAEAKLKEKNT